MGVHVDRLHAPAVDGDLAPPRGYALRVGMRGSEQVATDKDRTGHRAGGATDEVSASGHVVLPFSRRT